MTPDQGCPAGPARDDRKSAALVEKHLRTSPGARVIGDAAFARELLRGQSTRQSWEDFVDGEPGYLSVFFLDGEEHRRRRQAISQFFTPRVINTRYAAIMEDTTDALLGRLRSRGRGRLELMSFELAATVASTIVGLNESNQAAMARRIEATMIALRIPGMSWWRRPIGRIQSVVRGVLFMVRDAGPAIRARRAERREDVISHLLDEGFPDRAIVVECLTYGIAGMITTREFIVMAAWHLFDNDALRARFLAAESAEQIAIIEEIMRLDPVVNLITRRVTEDIETGSGSATDGEKLILNLRETNLDESAVGACPHMMDPDRVRPSKATYLSFGDGRHRCPGAQVALNETRIFLDRLLRVPGIRLHREPDVRWSEVLTSYSLRNAIVTCDRS